MPELAPDPAILGDDATARRVAQKDAILQAALPHAAFDGWGRQTLARAAEDAGLDKETAARLFPQGGDSLLAWLGDWADRRMLAAIEPAALARLPVRQRIATLVRARIEPFTEHKEAMRRAALGRGNPANALTAGRAFWRTVDRIWEAAGFPATREEGLSRHSRRATLAAVLIATLLYWLEDQSPGNEESWAFLDRRIENVMRFGQARGQMRGFFQNLPGSSFFRGFNRGRTSAR